MKNSGSMKKIFGENGERLPLIIGILMIMVVANYVFLNTVLPILASHAITVMIIFVAAVCVSEVSKYTTKQYYEYLQRREEVLFKKIEGLNDMLESLKRHATLTNKHSEQSNGSLTEVTDKILEVFENRANEVKESVVGQADVIEEKIAAKVSGEITNLSEKVDVLLSSSDQQKGQDWADSVEKNLNEAFRSLEDKVAVQLGVSARKLDEVITTMNEQNSALAGQKDETGEVLKQWMESEKNTSLQDVLAKLDSIESEMKEFTGRPTESGSDAHVIEAMISDRMDPILANLEEERKLLEHLGELVQNDGKNTSILLSDVSERLSADIAKGQSNQEEKHQIVTKQFEELAKKLEDTVQTRGTQEPIQVSAFASQTAELTKSIEAKREEDAAQFDLIKKQMDVIERVLVEKVMDTTTSSTVESIAKMSAEVNRSIRELQNAGQGTENMFRAVGVELSAVREKLEVLSAAAADGEARGESTRMSAQMAESLSNIMMRLETIEEKALMSRTDEGIISQESEKTNALLTEKMEQLNAVVSGMQNEVTKLLLRVLVSQDDHTERVQKTYDSMFSQISGMMKDTRAEIDLLKHYVEDGHRVLSENDRQSLQTAEEQLVQSTAMKEKIDIYSSISENYRKDMLMKLDYLQQQMQSLNLLAEVLKDVSMNSKLYNFRSDVR